MKFEKDYSYIPDLQRAILQRRTTVGRGLMTHDSMVGYVVSHCQPQRSCSGHKSAEEQDLRVFPSPDIIPDSPGQVKNTLIENVMVHMR